MSLGRFIKLWSWADQAPVRVTAAELEAAEERLGFRFPADYRAAVLAWGVPDVSIALLDFVVDADADMTAVSELVLPEEVVEMTEAWREVGLPETLVAFASGCGGKKFCFQTDAAEGETGGVWLFDREVGEAERVAESFDGWIGAFCDLKVEG